MLTETQTAILDEMLDPQRREIMRRLFERAAGNANGSTLNFAADDSRDRRDSRGRAGKSSRNPTK